MSQAACRSNAVEYRKVKGCTVMLMTHSVTFCRSSRGGMLHTVTYSRGKMVANRCVRHLDFLISVSPFSDCFRRIGMRPPGWRVGLLHSYCACHTQPSQALEFMKEGRLPLPENLWGKRRARCSSGDRV